MTKTCRQCGDERETVIEDADYECPRCFARNHDLPDDDEPELDGLTLSGPLATEVLEAWND